MNDQIADIRAFNRFYTRQIGLLNEHLNKSRFSLPEGRVLYEIAARGHTTLAEVARALGMDLGYASRLTRKLVAEGLIALTPSATDRRSNRMALTRDGDAAFAGLDGLERGGCLTRPLEPLRREALLGAMRTIRTVLGDIEPAPVILRPHRLGEIGWMIHRQGLLYNRQYGWNGEFEALIARIYSEYEAAPAAPPRNLWVAEWNGEVAGSIFCMPSEGLPDSAQLRLLYVEPAARAGHRKLLVTQCVAARQSGYARMRLWTHSIRGRAPALSAAGFAGIEQIASCFRQGHGERDLGVAVLGVTPAVGVPAVALTTSLSRHPTCPTRRVIGRQIRPDVLGPYGGWQLPRWTPFAGQLRGGKRWLPQVSSPRKRGSIGASIHSAPSIIRFRGNDISGMVGR